MAPPRGPIALMMSDSGEHCLVNGPWQSVGAEWKLNNLCQLETIAGPGWVDDKRLVFRASILPNQ